MCRCLPGRRPLGVGRSLLALRLAVVQALDPRGDVVDRLALLRGLDAEIGLELSVPPVPDHVEGRREV